MKTKTIWKSGQAFNSYKESAKIEVDGHGGFNPKALLLTGLAACSGIDVIEILEKMRVPFANLSIDAEAEQTDGHPRVFKSIHLTYQLKTEKDQYDKIKKAVDLSLDKYCGVAAMLKKNSEIGYQIVIEQ